MHFDAPLIQGTLIRRYKRFLADVELDDGSIVTAHCPNTGRMTTCAEPGWRVALSISPNPNRKYPHTWELVHNETCWICVNTGRANAMAYEAIEKGMIPELTGYSECLREQRFGNSRFDLLLRRNLEQCYVEVKSVTLLAKDGCYAFPDAITQRGRKHLDELINVVESGQRAAMLYIIARSDGHGFRAASEIDPEYAEVLTRAQSAGVELHAWCATITLNGLHLSHPIVPEPHQLPG